MEAQLRRRREGPWGLRRWGQHCHREVPRGRHVSRLLVALHGVASVREGQVDMEPHQFHCSTGIMVLGGEDSEPYMMNTVLDSGAGILCVSDKFNPSSVVTIYALQKRFPGVGVVHPYDGEQHQVALADGRSVPIER